VSTRLKGVEIGFDTTLLHVDEENGIAIYTVDLPRQISHHQRRQHHRLEIGADIRVPVHLETTQGSVLMGELRDISLGGIGARVGRGPATELQRGERLPGCLLRLPEGRELRCAMEVRFVKPLETPRQLHVGGRFLDLTRSDTQLLTAFLTATERHWARRRAYGPS
jgi:c-di-GMP-binding flagellar brake protein YcgR